MRGSRKTGGVRYDFQERKSALTRERKTSIAKATGDVQPTAGISGTVPSPVGKSEKQWICIAVDGDPDRADDLAAAVAERFAAAVEITEGGIRFFLPGEVGLPGSGSWEPELHQVLEEFRAIHGDAPPLTYASHLVQDEGWADRWKEHFKPLHVGPRFIVCPTWEEPRARTGDLVIRIDPGQAFGTGHHETTRLCLEWLGEHDDLLVRQDLAAAPPSRRPSLLDVGTGTAILAIGAALLGWSEVVAIDIDDEAVRVAAENVTINGLDSRIQLNASSVDEVKGHFDVVMANIQALPLIDLAGALADRLSPSGRLVLSGILVEQRDMVVAAYGAQGLRLTSERTDGEWCLLEFAVDRAIPCVRSDHCRKG